MSNNPDFKNPSLEKMRLDKWLWAARFFKTRSLAKQAIDGGKIHIGKSKAKASKEITTGITLLIRQGYDEKEIIVMALSDKRRGASEAMLLYTETQASINERLRHAAERKAIRGAMPTFDNRPTKKERRQIHRFKNINSE